MTDTAVRPPIPQLTDAERTTELTATAALVAVLIRDHGLNLSSFEVSHQGGYTWDPDTRDWTLPPLTEIGVRTFGQPREFVRWCRALAVDTVRVYRRDFDTCMDVRVRRYNHAWRLSADVRRPSSGPHLPDSGVEWDRTPSGRLGNDGSVSVTGLERALDRLERAS